MDATEAISCGTRCPGQRTPMHPVCGSNRSSRESALTATQTMIELLLCADYAVGNDQERAKQLINRVVEILRATTQRPDGALPSCARPGGLAPWQMRRITTHIDNNLSLPLTTDDLACVANLSRSHFSRAFKRSFGKTPRAYLAIKRTIRAQEMMLITNEPLSQIAVACGMVDQSHLCKLFRRVVGSNPHAWRRTFKETRSTGIVVLSPKPAQPLML